MQASTDFAVKVADNKGRIALGSRYAGKYFVQREEADGSTHLLPVLITPEREEPLTARSIAEQFAFLETPFGTDADTVLPPPTVIAFARETTALFQAGIMARNGVWAKPHIGANEREQVTLEWWHSKRSLTITVCAGNRVDFLKAWGSNVETEMADGTISGFADFATLWEWLHAPEDHGEQ